MSLYKCIIKNVNNFFIIKNKKFYLELSHLQQIRNDSSSVKWNQTIIIFI